MSLTIDTDTLHKWALDNGYVRLADITEFVRHQSAPSLEQTVELMASTPFFKSAEEVAHKAIDTTAELNDSAADLFPAKEPELTSKDVAVALRNLYDRAEGGLAKNKEQAAAVTRGLLAKYGARDASTVPADRRREFITEAEGMK